MEKSRTQAAEELKKTPAVSIKDLYHAYTGEASPAIQVDHFEMAEGEAVLITGKSGSGKSTFVNCINGVIPHIFPGTTEIDPQTHRGQVKLFELDVMQTQLSKLSTTIGTLLQDPETQVLNYKVEEEVAFGPENLCLSPEEISRRVYDAIESTGIRPLVDRETYTLSGGELQRVAMAAMLAMDPKVLILDEPTSNIDPEGTNDIFNLINKMRGKTMIVVEHKLERILPYVDRVVLVDKAKVALDLRKEELLDHLDELVQAGIEVPEHYIVAKNLGMTTTDITKVKLELRRRGIGLPKPERYKPETDIMHASVSVTARDRTILDTELSLGAGEVLAIMGKNGAGKSTLLKAIMGFTDRQLNVRLRLTVNGVDLSKSRIQERGKHLAFVPQNFDLTLVSKTVFDEICYSPKKRKLKDWKERSETVMKLLSLDEIRDKDPLTLSFGQRRRVAMGSALASGAKIIMMDEPTSGQDFYHREMLAHEITNLKKLGYSFIIVTHDARFVYGYSDRMIVLSEGKQVLAGPPEEVFAESERYGIPAPTEFLLRQGI